MEAIFELRIIHVSWTRDKKVISITKALNSLELNYDTSLGFIAETWAYPHLENALPGQLAVRVFSNSCNPKKINANGESEDLLQIIDPITHEKWWIENGSWKKECYLDAPSHRHTGKMKLTIGEQSCSISIHVPGFSLEEIDSILSDFRDSCWQLVLKDDSPFLVEDHSQTKEISEDFILHLIKFIRLAEKIYVSPKNELKEKQIVQSIDKAHPIPRTFMDIATKGSPKRVASRGHYQSSNIPENRYVLGLIEKINLVLSRTMEISTSNTSRIKRKITEITKRLELYTDYFHVSAENLNTYIQKEVANLNKRLRNIDHFISAHNASCIEYKGNLKSIYFKVTSKNPFHKSSCGFFINEIEYMDGNQYVVDNYLLEFSLCPQIESLINYSEVYFIEAEISEKIQFGTNATYKRKLGNIIKIELIQSEQLNSLNILKKQKNDLEANNWTRPLTKKEKEYQKNEKSWLNKQIKFLEDELVKWNNKNEEFIPFIQKIKCLSKRIRLLGITPINKYPGSITFIQNPTYSKVKSEYEIIINSSGLEESMLNSLLTINEYGILDLATIYEKWCLIKIVEIFVKRYGFAGKAWKKDLLKIAADKKRITREIKLYSVKTKIGAFIKYQPQLINNVIPDITVTLSKRTKIDNNEEWIDISNIVLDAKFKEYLKPEELYEEIELLTFKKNYAQKELQENVNLVYILHPSRNQITNSSTTQQWSYASFYGGNSFIDKSDEPDNAEKPELPDHKYGAILLRPGEEDNLLRLFMLVLEYESRDEYKFAEEKTINSVIAYDPLPNRLLCPLCLSNNVEKNKKEIGKKDASGKLTRYSIEYIINCKNQNCAHEFIIFYCKYCGCKIWKHGRYWTYHDTSIISPYDIVCPNCGKNHPTNPDVWRKQ